MEKDFPPLFTSGQEIATFLVSSGILSKAWEESRLASGSESFTLKEYEGFAYVAFPSFSNIEGYIVEDGGYGECNIQTGNGVFSAFLKGNADKPALVHQGALKLFLHIMQSTDFEAQLQIYTDSKQTELKPIIYMDSKQTELKPIIYTDSKQTELKPIIFVGHSLGGAVATLATLWVLQKRLRQSSPLCITFGCPLVGDVNLDEAIYHENWAGNFCHVVSKNDIVPRMLLAPFEPTVGRALRELLPYWWGNITNGGNDQTKSFIQDAYRSLLQSVRGSNNSPYKPFGTYIFCSSHGAVCIAESEIVLEMLRLTMQSQETDSDEIVQNFLLEHTAYGCLLEDCIQNSVRGKGKVKPDFESAFEIGILLQLEALDLEAQNENAQYALRRAAETENERNTQVGPLAVELIKMKCCMAELEWYKEDCEKEGTYYDAFKYQYLLRRESDADSRRIRLALFWDDIVERVENKKLPSDFQSQNKWIKAGTAFRRLVEPLDIAHYYSTQRNGHYLSEGRPNRHKVIQKWMEDQKKAGRSGGQQVRIKPAPLTIDSCFWAYVEEAVKDLENLKNGRNQSLQNLREFEKYVTTMVDTLSISSDVFLGGSSFMKWWEKWKEYQDKQFPEWRSSSSLYDIMTNESWKGTQKTNESWKGTQKRFAVIQETKTFLPSSGLQSQTSTSLPSSGLESETSEESDLAINSESLCHSVGQETATFLASSGILSNAWESCLATNSMKYSLNEYEGVSYVGFPSFDKIEDFIGQDSKYGEGNIQIEDFFGQDSKYGEGNIQTANEFFSGCLLGNDDLFHPGALMMFLHTMEITDFQEKLQIYTDSKQENLKPIIFVGHSLGGAVATLATLWVLEKRLRQCSTFCITFGSPLVGDVRLVQAVGRENWGGNFCHVVSKNDIVPRVLLAPSESSAEPLNALLNYWLAKITNDRNDEPDSSIQDAYKALLQSVQSVRKSDTSPYRPFGTYMFCSSNGAACIANSETVLEMLQLTIQTQETSSDISVQDCLLEHIRYDSVLERVIQNSIEGERIASSTSEYWYERIASSSSEYSDISLELEAIGIGAQYDEALLALRKARNIENKHNTNVAKLAIELSRKDRTMAELEWYKESCEKQHIFYYDSFRNTKDPEDPMYTMYTSANWHRLDMAMFWDEIMKKWKRDELPSNFQSQIKWINAGTAYRKLVEPLDIAYHYRTKEHISYLSVGERPNRYEVLQKWSEEKEKTGVPLEKLPYLSRESCFFARLEEAWKDFENLQQGQYDRIQSLKEFEHYVTRIISQKSISPDVIARMRANSISVKRLSARSKLRVLSIKVSSPNIS